MLNLLLDRWIYRFAMSLTDATLEFILSRIPHLTLGVVGDLFLDRYLDIDARLTEPSLETGLDAYQVVQVHSSPGAAGTVINNLAALGVGEVVVVSMIGDDGEAYELRQALGKLGVVDDQYVFPEPTRLTPTYTKPMLLETGRPPRELNRLDIKNRSLLPVSIENRLINALREIWPRVDGLVVLDQVSEPGCGVITTRVRDLLAELGDADPVKLILADSRQRINHFRSVCLKPNQVECEAAVRETGMAAASISDGTMLLAKQTGRSVFCTQGHHGIWVADPQSPAGQAIQVPAYPVTGPIDIVGAGDSTSAGIACAIAAGASLQGAAAFGNLVSSITIQQIGTTGTANPDQIRRRWQQVRCEQSSHGDS
jgi:rfaE bifunctional protein kinase chain/domain